MNPTCVLDNLGSLTGIKLTSISDQDKKKAEHLLVDFGSSRKGFETTQVAESLRNAISEKFISVELLKSLSKYCSTGQSWQGCIKPARAISEWLTGGVVIPRMTIASRDHDLPSDELQEICKQIVRFIGADGESSDDLAAVSLTVESEGYFDPQTAEDERQRTLRSIVQRRGQSRFRDALVAAYAGQCAVTGSNAIPALEAAHICPYLGEESNHVSNGLLLRADIHALFDLCLIGIDPATLQVRIARSLLQTTMKEYNGRSLLLPSEIELRPSRASLQSHWSRFQTEQEASDGITATAE